MRTATLLLAVLLTVIPVTGNSQTTTHLSTDMTSDGERLGNSVFLIETEIDRLNDRSQILKRREFQLKQAQNRLDLELKKLPNVKDELVNLNKKLTELKSSFSGVDRRTVDQEDSRALNGARGAPEPRLVPDQPSLLPRGSADHTVPDAASAAPPVAPLSSETTSRGPDVTYFCAVLQDDESSLDKLRKIESDADSLQWDIYMKKSKLREIDYQADSITQMLAREMGLEIPAEPSPEGVPESDWEPESVYERVKLLLSDIENELLGLDRYRSGVEQNCENLKTRIASLLTATGDDLREVDRELTQYARDLREAYQKASEQAGIDDLLNWAIIAMILAMVALYCSLLTFRKDLADAIIEDRTLLEVLSMGFLMLTVIILGTGRLLSVESLAALLGTIAGYIFGRRVEGEADDE